MSSSIHQQPRRTITLCPAPKKKDDVIIPMPQKLAVGAIAGVIGTMCIFPIDVVKTRLQNQRPGPDGKLMYRGVVHAFQTIIKQEGAASMYKGLGPNLVGVTPEKAIKLGANDFFREKLTDKVTGELSLPKQMLAGGLAGFCQVAATNPMEIAKLRMQLQNLKPPEQRLSSMQVVKDLGLRGLYKGVTVTWMRDVPYSFVFFPGYAILKDFLSDADGHAGIGSILTAGAVAGAGASWFCTPADCIKTRFQAEGATFIPYRNIAKFTGADITGITINGYQVKRANELNQTAGLQDQCRSVQGDFMKMPFEDNSFDAVYAIEATCHAPDRAGVYSEIMRVLKPGGVFACYEWCVTDHYDASNPRHPIVKKLIEEGDGLPDLAHTSVVDRALRDVGFEVIETRDCAEDPSDIPWYTPLLPSWRPWTQRFQFNWLGQLVMTHTLEVLEAIRLAPAGTAKVQKMLLKGGLGIAEGGVEKTFTPMYLCVVRKPL